VPLPKPAKPMFLPTQEADSIIVFADETEALFLDYVSRSETFRGVPF